MTSDETQPVGDSATSGSEGHSNASFITSAWAFLVVIAMATVGGMFMQCIMKGAHVKTGKIDWKFPSCPSWLNIPPLVGMIIAGCLARNFMCYAYMEHYPDGFAGMLRLICLSIILLRGGLELDFEGKGLTMVLLTLLPQLFEATAAAVATYFILSKDKFPFSLCYAHGFTLGAVSPAVVVPSMMLLHKQGYGVAKGIPTSMIAASSFDDIIAITAFGVFLTVSFNQAPGGMKDGSTEVQADGHVEVKEDTIGWEVGMNLVELAVGLGFGLALGYLFYFFQKIPGEKLRLYIKIFALLVVAIGMPLVAEFTHFEESKFVGIIFFGYATSRVWGHDKPEEELGTIWMFCQPILFGSVGAAVQFNKIRAADLSLGIPIILIGLTFRWIGAFCACLEPKYTNKERAFVAFGWIPKATVQAALGGETLTRAMKIGKIPCEVNAEINAETCPDGTMDHPFVGLGASMLTMAVFAIVLTAPAGAILIAQLGPKWLSKDESCCEIYEHSQQESESKRIKMSSRATREFTSTMLQDNQDAEVTPVEMQQFKKVDSETPIKDQGNDK